MAENESVGTYLNDRDWLFEQYWLNGRSATAIAAEVGTSTKRVVRAIMGNGIPQRTPVDSRGR